MPTVPTADNPPGRRPAISAHRGGSEQAPPGTYAAYQSALSAGAEYLEFDVRRTADGELVACHDARLGHRQAVAALSYPALSRLAGYEVPTTSELLRLLAGQAGAHIDLKEPDCMAAIMSQALSLMAPADMIVTTGDQAAIRELRRRHPAVPAGLTISGDLPETARYLAQRARRLTRSRLDAVDASGANWAVLHQRLARPDLLADCRRRGLATMVWTVNDDSVLTRLLASPAVDVVVTDRPGRAAALRPADLRRASD
jgi:glycerophosphoryl diester phosphodiesterase